MTESQQTPAKYFFFTFEASVSWSPVATLDEVFKTSLAESQTSSLLAGSRTKTEIITTDEDLLALETNLIHLWRYDSAYVDARGGITLVPGVGTPPFVASRISSIFSARSSGPSQSGCRAGERWSIPAGSERISAT